MNKEELHWLKEISTTTGISYSGDRTITTDFANKIIDYIEQLQNNWNELKKFNEEKLKQYQKQLAQASTDLEDKINYTRCYCYRDNLDKMQELEQGKDE